MTKAKELMIQSAATNSIVTVDYDADLSLDLLAACEDCVDAGDVCEFWTEDWRVHLRRR